MMPANPSTLSLIISIRDHEDEKLRAMSMHMLSGNFIFIHHIYNTVGQVVSSQKNSKFGTPAESIVL